MDEKSLSANFFLDSITSVFNLVILAFVQNEWMLYIGGMVAFLDNTSTTMFRSLISKNVNADEVGRVFSVVGFFQALLPFATGPAFGYLYKNTVEHQPNAFLLLVIGIKFVLFVVVFLVNNGMRREERRRCKKNKEKLDTIAKEDPHQLQTKLISENKDNLVAHHIAAKSLANNASDDESCESSLSNTDPDLPSSN